MKRIIQRFKKFLKNEDGLVTIEWVGIAAVVILAAIVITAAIMHSASNLGEAVINNIDAAADDVSNP